MISLIMREKFTMDQIESARKMDTNGWIEIKGNPITKVGVFPYLGSSLGSEFEQDKIYMVYRPEEELKNPETINSFKLLPWTDDHPKKLLGNPEEGKEDPSLKGVAGVTGEDVFFQDGYLKANIKTFSNDLAEKINSGKKELSAGYKFVPLMQKGVHEGIEYAIVQTNIRGNHLSLVDSGRSGADVSVLDKSDEEKNMPDLEKAIEEDVSLSDVVKKLAELADNMSDVKDRMDKMEKYDAKDQDEDEDEEEVQQVHVDIDSHKEEDDEEEEEVIKEKDVEDEEEKEKNMKVGMDSLKKELFAEFAKREKLVKSLTGMIGVFDASDMTASQVASYGIKKLGLNCKKGQEQVVLDAYLAGQRSIKKSIQSVALDQSDYTVASDTPDFVSFINNGGEL